MPLNTQIVRDDKPLLMPNGWGWWHVQCMLDAQEIELAGTGTEMGTPLSSKGEYVLTQEHTFTDPADGEVLVLKPGDKLRMWR